MRLLLPLFVLLLLVGCAPKLPNTWQARLDSQPPHPPLFVKIDGHGPPILLIHGLGTNHHSFDKIAPALLPDHTLYALDLKGFGNSPRPTDDRYAPYDQAAWIIAYIKEKDLKGLTIVSHSIGAAVAMIVTLKIPERIERLILIAPVVYPQYYPKLLSYLKRSALARGAFYFLPATWMIEDAYGYAFYDKRKIDPGLIARYAKDLNKPHARYAFLQTLRSLHPDDMARLEKRYPQITIPVLIVSGERDIVADRRNLIRLERTLPHATLKRIPRCGHIPQEECPDATARLIRAFSKRQK